MKSILGRPGSGYLSANTISLCRLLPQIAYYGWLAANIPDAFVMVPRGNLGNAVSAVMAKKMGARISKIGVATSQNDMVVQYFLYRDQDLTSDPTCQAAALSMDIASPSNLVRLLSLYSTHQEDVRDSVLEDLSFFSVVNDGEISQTSQTYDRCVDTSVGILAAAEARKEINPDTPIVVVATTTREKLKGSQYSSDPICRMLKEVPPAHIDAVVLVGMSGAGKTTLVKALGGVDVDDMLAAASGSLSTFINECTYTEDFFICEGHAVQNVLDEIQKRRLSGVVGTGGSVVHNADTIKAFKSVAPGVLVVWLFSEQERRNAQYPEIVYPSGVTSLEHLRQIRLPLYEEIADLQIRTDSYSVEDCAKILRSLLSGKLNTSSSRNQPDYTSFAPFMINMSSSECDAVEIVTGIMQGYGVDGQIRTNTTINDGRVEPGLSVLFHGLPHNVDAHKKHLTTREHMISLWRDLSVSLNLRCAYIEVFGRYTGCIHGFIQTGCPGALPVR